MPSPVKLGRLTRKKPDGSPAPWSFCAYWYEPEGKRRFNLKTQCKVIAEAKARKIYADRDKGGRAAVNTVGVCVDLYLASLGGLRDEKRKREAWKAAEGFWRDMPIDTVDEAVSAEYLKWRNRAVNTCRQELGLVRAALHHMYKKDAPKVVLPGIPESAVSHLSKPQFREFLAGCASPHVRLFAILGVATGGRKTALLEAKWDQVDWDRGLLNLNAVGRVQSHKKRATVPLGEQAMAALREAKKAAMSDYIIEYRGGRLLDIKKGLEAASNRSGIKTHAHAFRHSAAVWMAEARTPTSEIAAFLGHKDVNITMRVYAKYHPDHLRQAAGALAW